MIDSNFNKPRDPKTSEKKKFILFLNHSKTDFSRDAVTVRQAIYSVLVDHSIIPLSDPDEGLKILLLKDFELIVIDHSFLHNETLTVEYALEAKKRRKRPIFFITLNEQKLITAYRKLMFMYEEADNYFTCPVNFLEVSKTLRRVDVSENRRAKRFILNKPLQIYSLELDTMINAHLTDISLVGFGLKLDASHSFKRNDQLQIHIPISWYGLFHRDFGEILKLSGRVRRISIDGNKVGCSLEFITETKQECLIDFFKALNDLDPSALQTPASKSAQPGTNLLQSHSLLFEK